MRLENRESPRCKTDYKQHEIDIIVDKACELVENGKCVLFDAIKEAGVEPSTFYYWINNVAGVKDKVDRARKSACVHFEKKIAELTATAEKNSNKEYYSAEIKHRELQINYLKWLMSKFNREVYGNDPVIISNAEPKIPDISLRE